MSCINKLTILHPSCDTKSTWIFIYAVNGKFHEKVYVHWQGIKRHSIPLYP